MAEPTQEAKVIRIRDLTPDVRELTLQPQERHVSFQPGQWVSLKLPIGERPPLVRAYSLAEPEAASGHLRLVFDRVPGGLGSGYLYTVREGSLVMLSGPHGRFVLPEPLSRDLFLIGRFTGIVPIHCIVRHFAETKMPIGVTIVSVSSSRDELLYHEDFTELAARDPQLRYESLAPSRGRSWSIEAEVQTVQHRLAAVVGARREIVPMVCGIKEFVRPIRAWFQERGFDRREVKVETYD